ncbi:hypothetical protein [Clostridium tagluense]|uniref:hypothetical protein n=1 Tax=Clostridium tagluense TaxID=360422 RepID=UPI001C6E00D1|nr:hypothetical protein [Clostridium tagluense]MBW9158684.1 hypothetical protein [Clostridium tagluense]WLC68178.1 hypothetical protein KTC93_23740 [Clostridium tagluense]
MNEEKINKKSSAFDKTAFIIKTILYRFKLIRYTYTSCKGNLGIFSWRKGVIKQSLRE